MLFVNDILMYFTYNEGRLVVAERFLRTVKCKVYKKMTPCFSRSYLHYLDKFIDQCNNTYHC